MNRTFSKLFATAAAVTMIASAVPAVMAGAEELTDDVAAIDVVGDLEYRIDGENAIITGLSGPEYGDVTSIDIPGMVTIDGNDYTVVGVDDFALVKLGALAVVNAPDTLQLDYIGNVAFLTSRDVINFIGSELGDDYTDEDVLRYAAAKIEYMEGKELTDEELEEFKTKLGEQLEIAGVEIDLDDPVVYDPVSNVMAPLYQHLDELTVSDKTKDKIKLWVSSIPYNNLTVVASEVSDAAKYAIGREALGMNYSAPAVKGDANLDGVLNVRDAAFIANYLANGKGSELPANADYNEDGTVNVRDAAAIANYLAYAPKAEG